MDWLSEVVGLTSVGVIFGGEGRNGGISSLEGCCVVMQRSGQVSKTWKVLMLLPTATASFRPCHSGSGSITQCV